MRNILRVIVLVGHAAAVYADPGSHKPDCSQRSKLDDGASLRVQEYLHSASYFPDYTVRLYFRANCHAGTRVGDSPVSFPFIRLETPAKNETGVVAARHMFKNAKNVVIREDLGRIIRIWIGDVPTAILRTKIGVVNLDKNARATKRGAIDAILRTKELQAAMKRLGVATPSYASSEMAITPPPYPAKIRNVTLDQALDVIARDWDGIVIYGACSEQDEAGLKLFDIEGGSRVFF